jgi:hypothetical protein
MKAYNLWMMSMHTGCSVTTIGIWHETCVVVPREEELVVASLASREEVSIAGTVDASLGACLCVNNEMPLMREM